MNINAFGLVISFEELFSMFCEWSAHSYVSVWAIRIARASRTIYSHSAKMNERMKHLSHHHQHQQMNVRHMKWICCVYCIFANSMVWYRCAGCLCVCVYAECRMSSLLLWIWVELQVRGVPVGRGKNIFPIMKRENSTGNAMWFEPKLKQNEESYLCYHGYFSSIYLTIHSCCSFLVVGGRSESVLIYIKRIIMYVLYVAMCKR